MNEAEKRQNEYINQTAERVENRYDFKKAEKDAHPHHHRGGHAGSAALYPRHRLAAAGAVSGDIRGHRLRHYEEGRTGHPQRPRVRRELSDGRGHHRRLRSGHL